MLLDGVAARLAQGEVRSTRSWQRSFAKTLTWRLFATVDTFLISAVVTGSLGWAGSIVSVEIVSKTILYYVHERAWGRAGWGLMLTAGGAPEEARRGSSAEADQGDEERHGDADDGAKCDREGTLRGRPAVPVSI